MSTTGFPDSGHNPPHNHGAQAVTWPTPQRADAFARWLAPLLQSHGLLRETLRPASADASSRRYLRISDASGVDRIIMDAPSDTPGCERFVRITAMMHAAGVRVPRIDAFDTASGFMLLQDMGPRTLLQTIAQDSPDDATLSQYFRRAIEPLVAWQAASRPGELPPCDEALLRGELALFSDWYIARHRGIELSAQQRLNLEQALTTIVRHNLSEPRVFVHRDYMLRNLMPPAADSADQRLAVLDYQDAVCGPVSYDIASLMRDAFISWDEEFVIDITVRYWQAARKAALPVPGDFADFWRNVEWMGLQRHLKVAGIFARLTLRDGKPQYLADTPRFIAYIRATAARYRELTPLLRLVDELEGITTQHAFSFGRM